MTPSGGLVIVDKPAGWTSHDVVARIRRLAGTRRVGHAGTLDPMATGVLVVGVERATRLLGHLALHDKAYEATIRLGVATVTDDAEGDVVATTPADQVTDEAIDAAVAALTGDIEQVPSSVSAIKVAGRRSYARVRSGDTVELAARRVTVHELEVRSTRREGDVVDLDVTVVCSTGTYVRALARDLGSALGVGGHLTALRRTWVGPFDLDVARTLDELETTLVVMPVDEVARLVFDCRDLGADQARVVSHGGPLPWTEVPPRAPGWAPVEGSVPLAFFGPDGTFLALAEQRDGAARPLAVFV